MLRQELGSGLIDQSQKQKVAAMVMADIKVCAAVEAGGDASPVIETGKQVLGLLTLAISAACHKRAGRCDCPFAEFMGNAAPV